MKYALVSLMARVLTGLGLCAPTGYTPFQCERGPGRVTLHLPGPIDLSIVAAR